MNDFSKRILALTMALALPALVSTTVPADGTPDEEEQPVVTAADPGAKRHPKLDVALNKALGKPNSREGLIKANKQVFYEGDIVSIELKLPNSLRPLLKELAQVQLLMYMPSGDVVSFPVVDSGKFFEGEIDSASLPAGVYQLAFVLVKTGGDATQLSDWYGGFSALVSATRLKISEGASSDPEDLDGDGAIDGNSNGSGFVDAIMGDDADTSELEALLAPETATEPPSTAGSFVDPFLPVNGKCPDGQIISPDGKSCSINFGTTPGLPPIGGGTGPIRPDANGNCPGGYTLQNGECIFTNAAPTGPVIPVTITF